MLCCICAVVSFSMLLWIGIGVVSTSPNTNSANGCPCACTFAPVREHAEKWNFRVVEWASSDFEMLPNCPPELLYQFTFPPLCMRFSLSHPALIWNAVIFADIMSLKYLIVVMFCIFPNHPWGCVCFHPYLPNCSSFYVSFQHTSFACFLLDCLSSYYYLMGTMKIHF